MLAARTNNPATVKKLLLRTIMTSPKIMNAFVSRLPGRFPLRRRYVTSLSPNSPSAHTNQAAALHQLGSGAGSIHGAKGILRRIPLAVCTLTTHGEIEPIRSVLKAAGTSDGHVSEHS